LAKNQLVKKIIRRGMKHHSKGRGARALRWACEGKTAPGKEIHYMQGRDNLIFRREPGFGEKGVINTKTKEKKRRKGGRSRRRT